MRQILDALGRYAQIRVYAVLLLFVTILIALIGGTVVGSHFGYAFGVANYNRIEDALRTGQARAVENIIVSCEWREWKAEKPKCKIDLLNQK